MRKLDYVEVERKYDVDMDATMPALDRLPGVDRVVEGPETLLEADYFDTEDLVLAYAGIILRRRTGGNDAGWHLKLPLSADRRIEVRRPWGEGTDDQVPAAIATTIHAFVRHRPLTRVCVLSTVRWPRELEDAAGTRAAEICDDRVTATYPSGEPPVQWREWEVELVGAGTELLDAAGVLLERAGGRPGMAASKLHRALGVEPVRPRLPSKKALRHVTAGQLLTTYLEQHLHRLLWEDVRWRRGEPGSVHQMRIAARRLRSVLATYRATLSESSPSEGLRAELQWLGSALAEVRDAEVLGGALTDLVAAQPEEHVLGPVSARLEEAMRDMHRAGRVTATHALDSGRYLHLLGDLERFVADPPFSNAARLPAKRMVSALLRADLDRVRKRDQAAGQVGDPYARDLALHEVRKAAKRLRYAAESATPVYGKRAKRLARAAASVQEVLGDHQDTVVAREALRELGLRAQGAGENGFTFGVLHELERVRAAGLVDEYPAVLSRLLAGRAVDWLDV